MLSGPPGGGGDGLAGVASSLLRVIIVVVGGVVVGNPVTGVAGSYVRYPGDPVYGLNNVVNV